MLLVAVESVVFRSIIQIIVGEAVLVAGNNRLKVFDVVVLVVKVGMDNLCELARINEKIGYLFAKLWRNAHLCDAVCLGLVKYLAFACLKEAKVGYLESEIDFIVECGDELVELAHLAAVHVEDRA